MVNHGVTRVLGLFLVFLAVVLFLSCSPPERTSLKDLVGQFNQESPARTEAKEAPAPLPEGVRRFEWRDSKVWASFAGADLDVVTHLFMGEGRLDCQLPKVRLKGTVIADFEGANPWEALQQILVSQGYQTLYTGGRLLISRAAAPELGLCTEEVLLSHVAAEDIEAFLGPARATSPAVILAPSPTSNGIFLSGPCPDVDRFISLISAADRKAGTLSIETLIVKYSDDAGYTLGSFLSGQSGQFTGSIGPGTIQLHYNVLDKLPDSFDTLLNLQEREGKASIVSRPYIAVKSGREAKINVQEDAYFLAMGVGAEGYSGAVISKLESVPAGVVLKIRPVLLEDGKIDLKVEVEQSIFTRISNGGQNGDPNVARVEKSQASTSVTVGSGQTLIIGGMVREVRYDSNVGFPGIRKVPFLNFFGGDTRQSNHREELVVYLTTKTLRLD